MKPAKVSVYVKLKSCTDPGRMVGVQFGFGQPTGAPLKLTDRDVMVYSLKAGYGRRGARIGSRDGDAALFAEDMVAFWTRVLAGQ